MKLFNLLKDGRFAIGSVVLFVVFFVVVFPLENRARVEREHGGGSPDLSLFYSPDDLLAMAEAYGPEGRLDYVHSRLAFDLAWPAVYLLLLSSITAWGWFRAYPQRPLWRRLPAVALVGTLLDLGENITVSIVMLRYPAASKVAALLAPVCTFIKWFVLGAAVLLAFAGLILAVRRIWAADS